MAQNETPDIQLFTERFVSAIDAFLKENPEYVDAQGNPGGFFSSSITGKGNGIRFSFTPFDTNEHNNKKFFFTLGPNHPDMDRIAGLLKQKGFFPSIRSGRDYDKEAVRKELEAYIKKIFEQDSEFSPFDPRKRAFSVYMPKAAREERMLSS